MCFKSTLNDLPLRGTYASISPNTSPFFSRIHPKCEQIYVMPLEEDPNISLGIRNLSTRIRHPSRAGKLETASIF